MTSYSWRNCNNERDKKFSH